MLDERRTTKCERRDMKGERKNVIARTEGTKQSILHFSLFILSFFIITACTDYQEEFENAFGALEYTEGSSDSTPDVSSDSGSGKSSSSVKEKSSSSAKSSSSVKDTSNSSEKSSSSAKSSSSQVKSSSSSVKSSSSMGDTGEYTDVRNNYVYKYITHNGIKWMTENLKYPSEGRGLCYATVESNCGKYGRLYTWNDAKDACPDEWRLPSKSEMEAFFKNPYPDLLEKIGYGGMGSNWGGYWQWDDNTGVNHSGAHGKDSVGYYWTGTNDNGKRYYFKLSADNPVFAYWEDDNLYSYVRCVWGKESTSAASSSSVVNSSSSSGKASGWEPCKTSETGCYKDDRDGKTYRTVEINGLLWMKDNLNYKVSGGSYLPDSSEMASEYSEYFSTDYVKNFKKYSDEYGRYYSWSGAKNACPQDWRLPTTSEFRELIQFAGGKNEAAQNLKSTSGWAKKNGVDKLGFSALPAGYMQTNGFYSRVSTLAVFWSSDGDDEIYGEAEHLTIDDNADTIGISHTYKESYALSVRCIKGAKPLSSSSAKSSSSVVSSSSTTVSSSSIGKVKDRAGNEYPVVQIGEQYWMAENLNYKTEGSACYDDQESNCELYGRLYTWEAAMTACPDGYRLPSRNDYTILWEKANQMNGNSRPQDALWVNGTWAPNADNKTGFSAYPGGLWKGSYDRWLMDAFFWTSTPGEVYPTTQARSLHMNELNAYLGQDDPKTYMMSVRCVKN